MWSLFCEIFYFSCVYVHVRTGSGCKMYFLLWKWKCVSRSVMSDSLQPHGLCPTRLLCPWESPGKNIGVGSHSLLRGNLPNIWIEPGSPALQIASLLSESHGQKFEGHLAKGWVKENWRLIPGALWGIKFRKEFQQATHEKEWCRRNIKKLSSESIWIRERDRVPQKCYHKIE